MSDFRIIWGVLSAVVGLGLFITGLAFLSEGDGTSAAYAFMVVIPSVITAVVCLNED